MEICFRYELFGSARHFFVLSSLPGPYFDTTRSMHRLENMCQEKFQKNPKERMIKGNKMEIENGKKCVFSEKFEMKQFALE
ncbi:hypothetical protein CEXT_178811 [Caerostris extrusa]|uniref:Uncharacterized protein n=1 Tax=Caerostris extrusa TaxID=172846 RepID=A0AAV4Y1R5_CAEEX|nr:hypothetical protein CEXT_178811 [Caerostris extrusa]